MITPLQLENLSENWKLHFYGKLEQYTDTGLYIAFPKWITKIKIVSTVERTVSNARYENQEFTLTKRNYPLANVENTLVYVREDIEFLYFRITASTQVPDNYAIIFVK